MLSISDLKDMNFEVKKGDIKVKASDLEKLLDYFDFMQSFLANSLDELSEKEKNVLIESINFYKYTKNKYIVLGDLRTKQKRFFDVLKKFDDENFTKNSNQEEIDSARRKVLTIYLQAKMDRENLQKEIEIMEKELNL